MYSLTCSKSTCLSVGADPPITLMGMKTVSRTLVSLPHTNEKGWSAGAFWFSLTSSARAFSLKSNFSSSLHPVVKRAHSKAAYNIFFIVLMV